MKADSVTIPTVPPGRYYLLITPEMEPKKAHNMRYEIRVTRDVPYFLPFFFVPLLLLIPPIILSFRKYGFESRRWRESDYAPGD
jgi:hypothetical protein